MSIFRSKVVEIEAKQLGSSPASLSDICEWAKSHGASLVADHDGADGHCLRIPTPEGVMTASIGDWVIKGLIGEFYPCKDEVFQRKYEPVE